MHSPDWNDYRYFLAVVEAGSLSAAARRLGVDQPTVGRRIAALEQTLGVRLFHRHARGLSLSEAGRRIVSAIGSMAEAAATAERLVGHDDQRLEGLVRLSAPESLSYGLIAPALPQLLARYPQLEIELQATPNTADLPRGEADIALRLFRPAVGDLVVRHVGAVPFAIYATPSYLAHSPALATLAEVNQHAVLQAGPLLVQIPECRWWTEHSYGARVVLRSDSFPVLAQAASAGLGLVLLPCVMGDVYPGLQRVLPSCGPTPRQAWLVVHKDLRYVARIRVVLEFVAELLG